ncbi:HNH endonuclease [Sarcina ventriculi]|uniref:HNH endonuclease n=1 Tax=Sarcina ventriculi TaxID=1267 RepID=UPI000A777337|nr:HNH endonuclease signature motif containing protein [Sarcina ventriculi]
MLIKSRKKANGFAGRAVIRSGTGHKYWSIFGEEKQEMIQKLSGEIHDLLFKPTYTTPIKTLDLPIGGKVFSNEGLTLVYETINIVNNIEDKNIHLISDDITGDETVKCLKNTKKVLQRINSVHSGSLGLHPIVYFYSMRGRHKIASYYAMLDFVMYLEKENRFNDFIKVREQMEDILINYEFLVQQIVRKYRQSKGAYKNIKNYYILIMDNLLLDKSIDDTIENIINSKEFSYLKTALKDEEEIKSKKFTKERKSLAFIIESVKNANRCAICNGLLHRNSITIDHKERKSDGGLATLENAQLAHPYCNSTYKN